MRDPVVEFMNYNRPFARRNPELLRLKVARMAESPFAFFRGTFHLYARDVLDKICETVPVLVGTGVETDLVGDIHSENYGTYKAADDKIHYDINDFDETTHGHFDFDVCRMATSFFLASRDRSDSLANAIQVTLAGVSAYVDALRRLVKKGIGPGLRVTSEHSCDSAAINALVETAANARRADFINRLTEVHQGQRRIIRSSHYFNLPEVARAQTVRLLDDYRKRMPEPSNAGFYEIQDVCGRVSGIGSMGRLRYVALVNGKGNKDARNVLLEFKESRPSAYDVYRQRETDAAALLARAEQVVAMQRQFQGDSSPYLGFAVDGPLSFQVREVGPHDLRVDLKALKDSSKLASVSSVQAAILARAHAGAAARAVDLSNPLAGLSDADVFCQRVLAFVLAYGDLVHRDWARFVGHRADLEKAEEWSAQPAA
jgi:uncharacterized protein (DUF2252 family)